MTGRLWPRWDPWRGPRSFPIVCWDWHQLGFSTRYSYVVLPQPRWSGEKLMAPKTRPSLKAMGVPPVTSFEEQKIRMRHARIMALMKEKAMTVHDAEPGDVYVDEAGKLWRCIRPPAVSFEEVEGQVRLDVSGAWVTHKQHCEGALDGTMWNGWKRIWRKEEA